MRNHLFSLMMVVLLTIAIAVPVIAAPYGQTPHSTVTATDNANLRSGPGTTYDRIGGVQQGDVLTVVGCTSTGDWCKLDSGAWISAALISPASIGLPVAGAATTPQPTSMGTRTGLLPTPTSQSSTKVVSATLMATTTITGPVANTTGNLRGGPGTTFDKVGGVSAGQALTIVGQTATGDWYKLDDGNWIASFLIDNAPAGIVVVTDLPVAPAPTEAAEAATATQTPAAGARDLVVDFINPHYNCEQTEYTLDSGLKLWAYRSFQIDMYITNKGTEPFMPPWEPKRWIITDGTTDGVSDLSFQWVMRNDPGWYPQPILQPGQSVGWTFVAPAIDRNQWVKAVEFEHNGQVYHQDLDLGPYGTSYNFKDCGEDRRREWNPTPTPRP